MKQLGIVLLLLGVLFALPIVNYQTCTDYETKHDCLKRCCMWHSNKGKCQELSDCTDHSVCEKGDCPTTDGQWVGIGFGIMIGLVALSCCALFIASGVVGVAERVQCCSKSKREEYEEIN